LAQLHQLRGRVGRYKYRAYAYMMTPARRPVTPIAGKRLRAIEEYSQLGSGFKIALRDLEIRGAGNILGSEQSGHIQMVGYQMYCDMLASAVGKMRNEPEAKVATAAIDLGFSVNIPKSYISGDRQRLDVYRKIASAKNAADLVQIEEELEDVFGVLPGQVDMLLQWAQIRIAATDWKIRSITASGVDLIFIGQSNKIANQLLKNSSGIVRVIDHKTVNLRLEKRFFEPGTILGVLRKIFSSAGPNPI